MTSLWPFEIGRSGLDVRWTNPQSRVRRAIVRDEHLTISLRAIWTFSFCFGTNVRKIINYSSMMSKGSSFFQMRKCFIQVFDMDPEEHRVALKALLHLSLYE